MKTTEAFQSQDGKMYEYEYDAIKHDLLKIFEGKKYKEEAVKILMEKRFDLEKIFEKDTDCLLPIRPPIEPVIPNRPQFDPYSPPGPWGECTGTPPY